MQRAPRRSLSREAQAPPLHPRSFPPVLSLRVLRHYHWRKSGRFGLRFPNRRTETRRADAEEEATCFEALCEDFGNTLSDWAQTYFEKHTDKLKDLVFHVFGENLLLLPNVRTHYLNRSEESKRKVMDELGVIALLVFGHFSRDESSFEHLISDFLRVW